MQRGRWFRIPRAGALALFVPLLPLPAQEPPAEGPVIESIEILNNQYLQKETLLFYISTKPGDPYDVRKLREDFKRLWDTGFLDDLQIEAVDGPGGKVVRFKVTERKRIQIVDFRGSKDLTTSTIEDALKKADAQIKIDTFYDPAKARKVETIIKEMLAEKGRPFGTVKHEAKNIGGSGQQLSFVIDDGPKAKVHEIVFDGNQVFPDKTLAGKMKKIKEPGFTNLSWLGGKTTYTEDKWLGGEEDPRGDRGRLEDFYLDHGYVTARVGQPKISYTDGKCGWFKKKPVKLMRLEIPVTEGEQYRMGELKFEGLTVLKEDFVRGYFKMVPGDVYNDSKFKKAYEKLRDVYGSLGYFQWTGGTQRKPDPERKVVDITVKMEEDKQYFLGRITFTGNDQTRDKVIRREIYMNEGDVFNTEALKMSIKRVNQLGYFKPMEGAPDIRPSENADNKVDVTFKVEEQNRNQFTFGGGVSGYEGAFLNASFSTTNFLGRRRDGEPGGPDRQPHEELLVLRERALLPRPPHHRRSQRLPEPDHVPLLRDDGRGVRAADPGARPHLRVLRRPLLARVRELLLPDHRHLRRGPGHGLPPQRLDVRDRQRAHGSGSALTAIDPDYYRRHRATVRERHQPVLRAQHRRQPLHPAQRVALHRERPVRGRAPPGHGELHAADPRARALPALRPPHGARRARRGRLHPAVRRHHRRSRTTSATSSAARPRSAASTSAASPRTTR